MLPQCPDPPFCLPGSMSTNGQSRSGAGACTPCQPGTYAAQHNATSCTTCLAGKHNPTGGARNVRSCKPCSAGTYSSAGASTCTACPAGFYSDGATALLQRAFLRDEDGRDALSPATMWGAASCTACAAGTYAPSPGASHCTECPANSWSPSASVGEANCTCNTGFYGPDSAHSGACNPCPAGTYKSLPGAAAACSECPFAHPWSPLHSTGAEQCIENRMHGFFKMATNASGCCAACRAAGCAGVA